MTDGGLRVFRDAVAIVTGGASGIGRALGEALAERGAAVTLADVQADEAEEAARGLRARGLEATAAALDVTDHAAVADLVARTRSARGRLDFMFNNAGIGVGGETHEVGIAAWNRIIDVNLRGVVHGVHAAYPLMVAQGFGHIVNTASMAGLTPAPISVSYATTKHAVVGLSKSLRAEAWSRGVRVSALCPGAIRTPLLGGGRHGIFLAHVPEEAQRAWVRRYFDRMRPMEPAPFARKVLRAVARNRAIIVVPAWWKVAWWVDRVAPALFIRLAARHAASLRPELEALAERPGER